MHRKLLLVACLVLLPSLGFAADEEYGYPIPGAYEATIIGTPTSLMPRFPAKMHTKELVLDIFPEREKPPVFFYDEGLHCTFAYQKHKAPLVFIIAGSGSNDRADKLSTMMKAFYQQGFHVIALPSPSHANFIVSASASRVPGDLTEDAADLYRVMEAAWQDVRDDVEVSSFNLCGYSLGGTEAAFVAKLDDERKLFNFRKVLMINPSVSLYTSSQRIEALLKRLPGGPLKEGVFFNRMLSKFSQFYQLGNFVAINDQFLYAIYQSKLFSPQETAGLIGLSFRLNLAGMIFASDVMTNGGYVVPKNRVLEPNEPLADYFMVCTHLSYLQYFDEYFYPYMKRQRPQLTRDALVRLESLTSIEGYLKSTDKFGVMANRNDFLMSPEELSYLQRLFGERAKVYPTGGHLGNLEYKDNLAYMVGFFR